MPTFKIWPYKSASSLTSMMAFCIAPPKRNMPFCNWWSYQHSEQRVGCVS
jgi:hypothetical protein